MAKKEEYSYIKLFIFKKENPKKFNYVDVAIKFNCSQRTASRWIAKFKEETEIYKDYASSLSEEERLQLSIT
jgi:transposase